MSSALALKDHTHAGLYLPMTGRAADSDRLDGLDSIAFALSGHNHNTAYVSQVGSPTAGNFPTLTAAGELANSTWGPSSFALSGHNHDTTYLGIGATASDSNLLDGLDSIAFALTGHSHAGVYLPVAGMAADSSLLDGLDSAAFSLATHDHAGLYSPLGHNHTGTYLPLSGMAADSSLLDGLDSAAFSLATHDHAGLYSPLGHNHTGTYLPLSGMAADSSLLDGLDSAAFALTGHSHSGVYLPVGGVAADSSLLDGLDSSAFSPTTHDHDTAYLGIGATATDSDQLDGLDANQLMRAASGAIGDAPDANGDAVTAFITAPQAGFLVISGSLEAAGTSDDFGCRLSLDTSPISSSDRNTSLQGLAVCSTDGMLPVTAGAHTVALVTFGWDSAAFGNATVWVVFGAFRGHRLRRRAPATPPPAATRLSVAGRSGDVERAVAPAAARHIDHGDGVDTGRVLTRRTEIPQGGPRPIGGLRGALFLAPVGPGDGDRRRPVRGQTAGRHRDLWPRGPDVGLTDTWTGTTVVVVGGRVVVVVGACVVVVVAGSVVVVGGRWSCGRGLVVVGRRRRRGGPGRRGLRSHRSARGLPRPGDHGQDESQR